LLLWNWKNGNLKLFVICMIHWRLHKPLSSVIQERRLNGLLKRWEKEISLFAVCMVICNRKKEIQLWQNLEQEIAEYWLLQIFGEEVWMCNKSVWSSIMIFQLTENFTFTELVEVEDLEEKVLQLILWRMRTSEFLEI